MAKEQIDKYQLFCLILLFEIGSTTLFALGIAAKQDAWIAILVALIIGLGEVWIYIGIQNHFPDQNLAEILTAVFGKWMATPLILLYALFFFYISCFNLYEFSEFMIEYFLPDTPLLAVLILSTSLVVFSMFLGIEVFARTSLLVIPYFLFFLIGTYVLVSFLGKAKLDRLLPILENGITPVLRAVPPIVTFPFGEMVVFMMYLHYVNNKQTIRKTTFGAVCIAGILLAISVVTMIAILGVNITAYQNAPLFTVIRTISMGTMRFDPFGGAILFIGGFYKMTLYFNGSRLALETLFNVKPKHQKWLIILMAISWIWFIRVYFSNFTFYRWVGLKVVNPYIIIVYSFFIPFLLLIVIKLRIQFGNKNGKIEKT